LFSGNFLLFHFRFLESLDLLFWECPVSLEANFVSLAIKDLDVAIGLSQRDDPVLYAMRAQAMKNRAICCTQHKTDCTFENSVSKKFCRIEREIRLENLISCEICDLQTRIQTYQEIIDSLDSQSLRHCQVFEKLPTLPRKKFRFLQSFITKGFVSAWQP